MTNSYGIRPSVATYALLATKLKSIDLALIFITEQDFEGYMEHPFVGYFA